MLVEEYIYIYLFFPIVLFCLIIFSRKIGFIDKPNKRKLHKSKVVNTSGIILYFFMLYIVATSEYSTLIDNIITTSLIVALIGFFDDRLDFKPMYKLIFLVIPSGYLIFNGFELRDLGSYEFIGKIYLGKISIIFTFLSVLLLINSINYLDGTDGLLIGYIITSLVYLSLLSENNSDHLPIFKLLIYFLSVTLIINFMPIKSGLKSFFGDSGSLFSGFFLSFILIYLYKYEGIHPSYLIWSCWLAVYDFLYVTFIRLKNKTNLFSPDKSHLHHIILNHYHGSHLKTFFFISALNILIITIGFFVSLYFGKIYSLILFIIFFKIFVIIRYKPKFISF